MCVSCKTIKIEYLYIVIILLAISSSYFDVKFMMKCGQIITDIFIKIFKCVSLPIIALSIIVTLSSFRENAHIKSIWKKIIFYTITTTIIASIVACVLYYIIKPTNINTNNVFSLNVVLSNTDYMVYLKNIIPSNIFVPFIEHSVISVLLISIVVGIAISFIPEDDYRHAITNFFKGSHGIFIIITSWIVKILPIALFGFITTTIAELQSSANVTGLSKYLLVVVLSNVVQGLIILPIFLLINKINPIASLKGMLPALSVAFFSKSSVGTLPVTINTIENNLNVHSKNSRLILPLCTSINMNGCAAFIFTTVIYLMQNNGISIDITTMMIWILISTIAAIGNAGVPMGCFFLSASLLTSMNISIEMLGIILPFYSIIDMIETALNVWSDACITKVIDVQSSEE